jgi:hypothetical protein
MTGEAVAGGTVNGISPITGCGAGKGRVTLVTEDIGDDEGTGV